MTRSHYEVIHYPAGCAIARIEQRRYRTRGAWHQSNEWSVIRWRKPYLTLLSVEAARELARRLNEART